jgi:predicted nucleotidyltransferase
MNNDELIKQNMAAVCTALAKHKVDFLIVGGFAVNVYGYRRPSTITMYKPELKADFDFWYKPTLTNYQRLLKALEELGVDIKDLQKEIFDPKKTFLKIPHKDFHTDFLPVITGLGTFVESQKNATLTEINGAQLPVIGYNDLILSKLAINRPIDLEDIKALDDIQKQKNQNKSNTEEQKPAYKKSPRRKM